MNERLSIEIGDIEQAATGLRKLAEPLWTSSRRESLSDLSAFSTVSGFRNVGLRLGRISDFYSPEALGALADRCCVSAQRR